MFIPPLRQHYESILEKILGISSKLKSSSLLQAYATFSAMLSMEAKLSDAYSDVRKEYADYQYAFFHYSFLKYSKIQISIF